MDLPHVFLAIFTIKLGKNEISAKIWATEGAVAIYIYIYISLSLSKTLPHVRETMFSSEHFILGLKKSFSIEKMSIRSYFSAKRNGRISETILDPKYHSDIQILNLSILNLEIALFLGSKTMSFLKNTCLKSNSVKASGLPGDSKVLMRTTHPELEKHRPVDRFRHNRAAVELASSPCKLLQPVKKMSVRTQETDLGFHVCAIARKFKGIDSHAVSRI